MPRYIDLDKLLKDLEDTLKDKNPNDIAYLCIKLFIGRLNQEPAVDVVPKSEEGAECPTCHGTGRIGTTDWLTKNMTEKQIAEEKAKAIAEHEQYIMTEYAKEIFEEISKASEDWGCYCISSTKWGYVTHDVSRTLAELRKKYT